MGEGEANSSLCLCLSQLESLSKSDLNLLSLNLKVFKNIPQFRLRLGIARQYQLNNSHSAAFTLTELVVVLAILGVLAVIALPAMANAKIGSRQLSCLNNLRQLGIAGHMYVTEYQQYTGAYSPTVDVYVWPSRSLGYTAGQRNLFSCPAAVPTARWDTNLNSTLKTATIDGKVDRYAVSHTSRFSYGINDWGLSNIGSPQLGLGGDIDGSVASGPVRDNNVVAPSQMIMLGDTPAPANAGLVNFAASLDPTDSAFGSQLPSNRHQYLTDLVFTDGHTETPQRKDVINPVANNFWRNRWNNDNQPHNEITWTFVNTSVLDPSY